MKPKTKNWADETKLRNQGIQTLPNLRNNETLVGNRVFLSLGEGEYNNTGQRREPLAVGARTQPGGGSVATKSSYRKPF